MSGIKLVHDDVIAALARAGIERFSPEGEQFDPQMHEAIAQSPSKAPSREPWSRCTSADTGSATP